MKVYYPHGGHHYLLHWWSYDERGHIILARSSNGIHQVFNRVIEEHTDAEIRNYLEIEIVAPSKLHSNLAKAMELRENIDAFHMEIIDRLSNVIKSGKSLPSLFEICSNYELEEEDAEEREKDEWSIKTHYFCKNCYRTIKMIGMTKDDLYNKYNDAWRKIYPIKSYDDPKRIMSRAEMAKDDEELYFANAAFGHHSSGIDLNKIDWTEVQSYRPTYLTDRVIFLYRKLCELDALEFENKLNLQKKITEERKDNEEKNRILEWEKNSLDKIETIITFFENK